MTPVPTPERVARGRFHWMVWFAVTGGQGRVLKLTMVPRCRVLKLQFRGSE